MPDDRIIAVKLKSLEARKPDPGLFQDVQSESDIRSEKFLATERRSQLRLGVGNGFCRNKVERLRVRVPHQDFHSLLQLNLHALGCQPRSVPGAFLGVERESDIGF
ncbi:hypothetical protein TNCV_4686191 [Trichonephila clavipes]|nr:hypothetical protein TNCV_4686191 [Trichonephila clavipes]